MKKLILITVLTFVAVTSYGQTLQKGNFIGFHVYTVTLAPNVTMNQFMDFYNNKVGPVYEKNFQCKAYSLKGIRGECPDCVAGIIIWKSEADRDKFFNKEGGLNEVGQAAMDKCQSVLDELAKLGTSTSKYTDWVIQ